MLETCLNSVFVLMQSHFPPPHLLLLHLKKDDYYRFLKEVSLNTEWPLMLDLAGAPQEKIEDAINGMDYFTAVLF